MGDLLSRAGGYKGMQILPRVFFIVAENAAEVNPRGARRPAPLSALDRCGEIC